MNTTKWTLDPTHSEIQFKIKHLMISTVTGQFNTFSGTVQTDNEDFSTAKISFSADIDSISTNNEQRDQHLKNGDFFDAENFPTLSFEASGMEKVSEDTFRLQGSFTMRGVSKPVSLEVEFGGNTIDPWGNSRVGFAVSGKIRRSDFGVSFGILSETGNVMLADEVKIFANVQFVKQAALQAA